MPNYSCPEKIYKYTSLKGVLTTLEKQTIRLSQAADFNDPIDMLLQDIFLEDLDDILEGIKRDFVDFILDEEITTAPSQDMLKMLQIMRATGGNKKEEIRRILKEDFNGAKLEEIWDINAMRGHAKKLIDDINNAFSRHGIFCSTTNHKNLLMWAHYAERHFGAVLEFTPNREKNSVLLASKPVVYAENRPILYKGAKDFLVHSFQTDSKKLAQQVMDMIIYTKSKEWSYEEEYRLCICDEIKLGENFATHRFHNEEITSVFIGCRMGEENKAKVISLARQLNPAVKLYQADIHPRQFQLDFVEIK